MTPTIERVAVVGAGTMGSGIAQTCAMGGLEVALHDVKKEQVEQGRERIASSLAKRVDKGKMTPEERETVLDRLHATHHLEEAVEGADLVVEAVFEDMDVKQQVFDDVEDLADADAIFATNTSSLSVTEMARATERPDRFAGLHFFFPAHKNWLVEVVPGERTDDDVVEALLRFSRRIRKVPIETADRAGFAVNRFFVPWVNEAVRLLDEDVANVPTIDAAAKEAFEIGMGPFELMNVTGVRISLHAQRSLHGAFGAFYEPAEGLVHQVEEVGEDWDLAGDVDEDAFPPVKERLRAVVFGIACHLVQEGVATPRDTDKGATIGLRWSKGPFRLMNEMGLDAALGTVESLHQDWGDAFPLPDNLSALADEGMTWQLPKVNIEKQGPVATVLVDRPEKMNALNPGVLRDLRQAFDDLRDDPDVRAVVLTGEGPKAFVAGADIPFMAEADAMEARGFTELGQETFRAVSRFPGPVVGALNGLALGGGLELALACDILLADETAVVGLPETSLGIIPGFGGTQRLPRMVGAQWAKRLIFTADRIPADQALEIGLVTETVPDRGVRDRARELASAAAANAPVAVQQAKIAVDRGLQADLDTGLGLEQEAVTLTFTTDDKDEGMRAFLERREPEFEGR